MMPHSNGRRFQPHETGCRGEPQLPTSPQGWEEPERNRTATILAWLGGFIIGVSIPFGIAMGSFLNCSIAAGFGAALVAASLWF